MSSLLSALNEFWRVDNKHGLYPRKECFSNSVKYSGVIYFLATLFMLAIAIVLSF